MDQEPKDNQNFKDQILQKIEADSLSPKSRWVFNLQEFLVWTFLVLLVVISAIAVSVTVSAALYGNYALYQATHLSFVSFFLEILPYLWLIVFGLMVLLSIYNVRHTKTGYRYALWKIIGGTLLLSVITGGLLHILGIGFAVDQHLGRMSADYPSQEKNELRFWQNPEAGRLVVLSPEVELDHSGFDVLIVRDIKGKLWRTNINSLGQGDLRLLSSGKQVRLVGQQIDSKGADFYACTVFPWVFEYQYSRQELRELHEATMKKLANFRDRRRNEDIKVEKTDLCDDLRLIKNFAPKI